ncbi:MAG: glycosyltransferase family 2 protein [Puniceicoccaceae bacterium]
MRPGKLPTISILLPVRNGVPHLAEAIQSLVDQTYEDWELLIGNDASTDATEALVSTFVDERIHLKTFDRPMGVARVLNALEKDSRGELIARMDADDICLPQRLETQVDFLKENPALSLVGCWAEAFGAVDVDYRLPASHEDIFATLLFQPSLIHPSVIWRRDRFREFGLCYQEDPPTAEDYALWWEAGKVIRMANVSKKLIRYRVNPAIKISAYLEQQVAGDLEVKSKILDELGLEVTSNDLTMLQRAGKFPQEVFEFELVALARLLRRIRRANAKSGLMERRALERVLVRKLYLVACMQGRKGEVMAAFRAFWGAWSLRRLVWGGRWWIAQATRPMRRAVG